MLDYTLELRKVRVRHLRYLAKQSHLAKISRVKKITEEARAEIKSLTDQELFLTGLSLYWAEGFKSVKESRLGFCNLNPATGFSARKLLASLTN